MSVKRFVAKDMRRALELVRQEMGPEAIILSSRRVPQGVEILTTAQPQAHAQAQPVSQGGLLNHAIATDSADIPMGSDDAWGEQMLMEEAIHHHGALRHSQPADVSPIAAASRAPNTFTAAFQGSASGKTPAQLADEIEQARMKMLAARKQQELEDLPIAQLAERQARGAVQRAELSSADRAEAQHSAWLRQADMDTRHQPRAYDEQPSASSNQPSEYEQQQQMQMKALQSELADMRLLLEEQLTRMANTPQMSSPLHSGLMRRLKQMGLSDGPAAAVVKKIKKHSTVQEAWADTLATLSRQLVTAQSDQVMQGGVFAFVGPTGVGKTTTIAKLAARYVLEHGAENVALVTTDTYRIAAHDQLRSLGRILNVQVKVVEDHHDLPAVLRSLKGCPLVLIDTAGFRHGDAQLKEQLQALATVPGVQTLLVMACNSQLQMMKATVHAHQSTHLAGCVLTKLDESSSLGEAMSVLLAHKLTLHYTTNGQEIPQDIELAKGHRLVAKAVALMKSGIGSQAMLQEPRS
jgi:flagellar biosynthesis protein FlhF